MGDVYANGLEISGKAVNAKTIAVMPDVCFTPPENPATPPGIPIPYPSFGMASDSEKGTGTVFIGGKTVNIKNKSDESKTSGTEAGCAAKKGVITSKNTGKKYFNSWSNDVKFDGEPVIRFSDLATHNHASPGPNTPPGPEICKGNPAHFDCSKMGIKPYKELECPDGYIKEHTVEVQFFTAGGVRDFTLKCCEKYDEQEAPCICMKGEWISGESAKVKGVKFPRSSGKGTFTYGSRFIGKARGTPHYYKSADARNWITNNKSGKLGDFSNTCIKSTVDNIGITPGFKAAATKCLEDANMEYLKKSMGKTAKQVKDQNACHSTCARAKDQSRLVKVAKKRLKKAAPKGATVVVRATDVASSKVDCT
jgi:hypothetical protein